MELKIYRRRFENDFSVWTSALVNFTVGNLAVKEIAPYGNFAVRKFHRRISRRKYGNFAVRKFRRRKFCRTDISPCRNFAVKKFRRTKFSPYGNFVVYVFAFNWLNCCLNWFPTPPIDVEAFARLKDSMGSKPNVYQNETEMSQQKHLCISGGLTVTQLRHKVIHLIYNCKNIFKKCAAIHNTHVRTSTFNPDVYWSVYKVTWSKIKSIIRLKSFWNTY